MTGEAVNRPKCLNPECASHAEAEGSKFLQLVLPFGYNLQSGPKGQVRIALCVECGVLRVIPQDLAQFRELVKRAESRIVVPQLRSVIGGKNAS